MSLTLSPCVFTTTTTTTAELPFVAANVWTYLPEAAHYLPARGDGLVATALRTMLGGSDDWAISYLSAPCYFAVTMDAIALGRWFDGQHEQEQWGTSGDGDKVE